MLCLAHRMDKIGSRNDIVDAARLEIADEMPCLLRKRRALAQKLIGAVLAEGMRTTFDSLLHLVEIDGLRNCEQLHFMRVTTCLFTGQVHFSTHTLIPLFC